MIQAQSRNVDFNPQPSLTIVKPKLAHPYSAVRLVAVNHEIGVSAAAQFV
jgi:hypothetical protein